MQLSARTCQLPQIIGTAQNNTKPKRPASGVCREWPPGTDEGRPPGIARVGMARETVRRVQNSHREPSPPAITPKWQRPEQAAPPYQSTPSQVTIELPLSRRAAELQPITWVYLVSPAAFIVAREPKPETDSASGRGGTVTGKERKSMAIYAKKGAIELARAEKGWSCAELARKAGVSGPTVTRKEQGFPVSPATARKLADALEKPLVDLFEFRTRSRKEV